MRQHFLLLLLLLTPRLADAAESLGDRISANFFFEASMPLSKDAAVAAGWTLVDSAADAANACDPLFGVRFRKAPALSPTMLFDARGQVAGMQWGVNTTTYPTAPCSSVGPPYWHPTDPSVMSATVYFSDPAAGLCDPNVRPVLPEGSVGDRVWVRNSTDGNSREHFYAIPLSRAGAGGKTLVNDQWATGGCLPAGGIPTLKQGMGNHYWRFSNMYQDVMTVFPFFLLYDQTDRLLMIGLEAIAPTNVFPTNDGKKPAGCPLGPKGTVCPTSTFRCQTNPLSPIWPNGFLGIQCGKNAPSVDLWEYPTQPLITQFFQSPMMPGEIIGLQNPGGVCGSYSAFTMHVAFRDADGVTGESCRVDYTNPVNAKVREAGRNTTKALEIIANSYNLNGLVRNCSAVVARCSAQ